MVESSGILDGILFYHRLLDLGTTHWRERAEKRETWHKEALKALSDAEMIFADPDNGLSVKRKPSRKGSEKYILPNEVMDYYNQERDEDVREIAKSIIETGVKNMDALHIACAIIAESDYFITTDDRLLKYQTKDIQIVTPEEFIRRLEAVN